jgi:hypothetical protein
MWVWCTSQWACLGRNGVMLQWDNYIPYCISPSEYCPSCFPGLPVYWVPTLVPVWFLWLMPFPDLSLGRFYQNSRPRSEQYMDDRIALRRRHSDNSFDRCTSCLGMRTRVRHVHLLILYIRSSDSRIAQLPTFAQSRLAIPYQRRC